MLTGLLTKITSKKTMLLEHFVGKDQKCWKTSVNADLREMFR